MHHCLGCLHFLVEDRLAITGTLFRHYLPIGFFMFSGRRQRPDILFDKRFGCLFIDISDKDKYEIGSIVYS